VQSSSVAVIIPVYNGAKFIRKTLDSILAQDPTPEIICVDDGSTDDTVTILDSYASQIRLLHHPNRQNRGAPASINLALQKLNPSTEFVAFCDSDDIWYAGHIASALSAFQRDSELALLYSNGSVIDENDAVLYEIMPNHKELNQPEALLVNNYIRTPSMVVLRRNAIEHVGLFTESLLYAKDHDYWLRVCEQFKIGFIDEPLTGYRTHGQQQSGTRKQWDEGFAVVAAAKKRTSAYSASAVRKRHAVLHFRLAQHCSAAGAHLRCFGHLIAALFLDFPRACRVGVHIYAGKKRITNIF